MPDDLEYCEYCNQHHSLCDCDDYEFPYEDYECTVCNYEFYECQCGDIDYVEGEEID